MITLNVRSRILHTALALIFIPVLTAFSQEKPPRPLTPDDLLKLEDVGQVALSPNGEWLAYVIRRSKATAAIHTRPALEGNDRGDVWLVSTAGGAAKNLTHGATDGSGWWPPMWSPDRQSNSLRKFFKDHPTRVAFRFREKHW